MEYLTSGNIQQDIIKLTEIQGFSSPLKISDTVTPIIGISPLNRPALIVRQSYITNQTSATLYTTKTKTRTFLVGAALTYIKDATSTATSMKINATPKDDSTSRAILAIPGITLTPANGSVSINCSNPIELEEGAAITLTSDTNVANITLSGTIYLFEVSIH